MIPTKYFFYSIVTDSRCHYLSIYSQQQSNSSSEPEENLATLTVNRNVLPTFMTRDCTFFRLKGDPTACAVSGTTLMILMWTFKGYARLTMPCVRSSSVMCCIMLSSLNCVLYLRSSF